VGIVIANDTNLRIFYQTALKTLKKMFRNSQTGQDLSNEAFQQMKALQSLREDKLPKKIGRRLEKLIDDSFDKEQYPDKSKWQDRKKDKEGKNARNNRRGLLIKTGEMRNSMEVNNFSGGLRITSDKEYTTVHNEGLQAGRGKGFKMPQRQFAPIEGESLPTSIEKEIEEFLDSEIHKILG
jgi:phage virion morphogenesis protein